MHHHYGFRTCNRRAARGCGRAAAGLRDPPFARVLHQRRHVVLHKLQVDAGPERQSSKRRHRCQTEDSQPLAVSGTGKVACSHSMDGKATYQTHCTHADTVATLSSAVNNDGGTMHTQHYFSIFRRVEATLSTQYSTTIMVSGDDASRDGKLGRFTPSPMDSGAIVAGPIVAISSTRYHIVTSPTQYKTYISHVSTSGRGI